MSEKPVSPQSRDDETVPAHEEQRRQDTSRREAIGVAERRFWPEDDGWICNCIILREDKVLLLQRDKDGYMGGMWDLPGGKLDDVEEPIDTARRELYEEAGLVGVDFVEVAHYSNADAHGDNFRFHTVTYEVTEADSSLDVQLSDEHPNYCWVDSREFLQLPVVWYVQRVMTARPWFNP